MAGAVRRTDREIAREVRGHVDSAGGSLRMPAADLARAFGRPALAGGAREDVARALADEGVLCDPPIDRRDPGDVELLLHLAQPPDLEPPELGDRGSRRLLVALLAAAAFGSGVLLALVLDGDDERTVTTQRTDGRAVREAGRDRTERERNPVTERELRTVTVTETVTETVTVTEPAAPP